MAVDFWSYEYPYISSLSFYIGIRLRAANYAKVPLEISDFGSFDCLDLSSCPTGLIGFSGISLGITVLSGTF